MLYTVIGTAQVVRPGGRIGVELCTIVARPESIYIYDGKLRVAGLELASSSMEDTKASIINDAGYQRLLLVIEQQRQYNFNMSILEETDVMEEFEKRAALLLSEYVAAMLRPQTPQNQAKLTTDFHVRARALNYFPIQ